MSNGALSPRPLTPFPSQDPAAIQEILSSMKGMLDTLSVPVSIPFRVGRGSDFCLLMEWCYLEGIRHSLP